MCCRFHILVGFFGELKARSLFKFAEAVIIKQNHDTRQDVVHWYGNQRMID